MMIIKVEIIKEEYKNMWCINRKSPNSTNENKNN